MLVLRGIFGYRNTNDEQDAARRMAQHYSALAEQTTDPSYRIVANRFMALAMHYGGDQLERSVISSAPATSALRPATNPWFRVY